MGQGEVVRLNVGGMLFTTTLTTLTSCPSSMLAAMFHPSSPLPSAAMVDGAHFIDANPAVFEVILDYLRHRVLLPPPLLPMGAVLAQARYFGLDDLAQRIMERRGEEQVRVNAGGTVFESTRATLASQPDSLLASMVERGDQIFLDVCPQAFEVLLCFLRCGARKVPSGSSVCTESIGAAAQLLGLNICLESKRGAGFCKIAWMDERKEKTRYNQKMDGSLAVEGVTTRSTARCSG